ncbi:putative Co/Zn/Cd efflux system membrane fusion protein [Collimonas arenae]|uniref:Putative Co/Zn/Cd efflux system membrane fusion protein n=1 Tax=Collimonas arenae TaxID=279058 RepID=A0A0A1F4J5_9BURK|nr:copper-binding protein [Collimonas arenae]AIY39466.1 putative Co/Zn/Cd efflux system membrane fusion protein [Collimonas arenae]
MKRTATLSLILALSASGIAFAQSGTGKDMAMKDMDMKGMDMNKTTNDAAAKSAIHQATGVVKAVDSTKGTVTLAHGPINTLKWPAMTMTFMVNDKMLFDKLAVDKKVNVEIRQQGANYVVTAVK